MKKQLCIMLFTALTQAAVLAQVAPFGNTRYNGEIVDQRMFQDCEGNIFSLGDLMVDKPLIVFQSTVDCGYCFEEAPEVSESILKYKDKINFAFFLTRHNNLPSCSGKSAGDHDWPDDWRNRYSGYKNIPISIQGTDYFMLNCEVTTSFGSLDPRTNKILDGGCRAGGRLAAIQAALKLYEDGVYTQFATTVAKPAIDISGSGNTRSITLTCATANAEIYYTIDGKVPSKNSTKYNGAFEVSSSRLIKTVAIKRDMNISPVTIKFVEINNTQLIEVGKNGIAYEWTGLKTYNSNDNKKEFKAANDGQFVDARLNNGNDDNNNAYEAVGIIWDNVQSKITSAKLTHYTPNTNYGNSYYFGYGVKIQTTQDGTTWKDLDAGHFPEYPYGSITKLMNNDPMMVFSDEPITAKGIRIIGQVKLRAQPSGHLNWGGHTGNVYGMKELEVFVDNTITANEAGYNAEGIKIFPNPSNSVINVETVSNNFELINITDLAGRILKSQNVTSLKSTIEVSDLTKGLYIVELKGKAGNIRRTIVIE